MIIKLAHLLLRIIVSKQFNLFYFLSIFIHMFYSYHSLNPHRERRD